MFIHQRKDLMDESIHEEQEITFSSTFNMQEYFQAELHSPTCLGEAEFNCKYHEL